MYRYNGMTEDGLTFRGDVDADSFPGAMEAFAKIAKGKLADRLAGVKRFVIREAEGASFQLVKPRGGAK